MATVHTAKFETPEGLMISATSEGCLLYLGLPRASGRGLQGFLERHARGVSVEDGYAKNRQAIVQILEYLEGKRHDFDLEIELRGTPFQRSVWDALCQIPYGETRTYGELAATLGHPNAFRAVGAANGANPIPLIVPCHRVIASGGKLGGYGGGLRLKQRLLAMERRTPIEGDLL
jgi:O-6-methylguanine DNA methyltransferase